jgi:hypothetical protein
MKSHLSSIKNTVLTDSWNSNFLQDVSIAKMGEKELIKRMKGGCDREII